MLLTATALPLLVALSAIGLESGHMLPENAAALVGAGVLSVITFPALASVIGTRGSVTAAAGPETRDGSEGTGGSEATLPR